MEIALFAKSLAIQGRNFNLWQYLKLRGLTSVLLSFTNSEVSLDWNISPYFCPLLLFDATWYHAIMRLLPCLVRDWELGRGSRERNGSANHILCLYCHTNVNFGNVTSLSQTETRCTKQSEIWCKLGKMASYSGYWDVLKCLKNEDVSFWWQNLMLSLTVSTPSTHSSQVNLPTCQKTHNLNPCHLMP